MLVWIAYNQARNYVNTLSRTAKRSFLISSASDGRKFWQSIFQFTSLSGKRRVEPPWSPSSPSISKITANAINKFFESAFSPMKYNGVEAIHCSRQAARLLMCQIFFTFDQYRLMTSQKQSRLCHHLLLAVWIKYRYSY